MEEVIYKNQKVLKTQWFRGGGIVKTKDVITSKINLYIGACNSETEWEDIEYIIDLGTKSTEEKIKEIFKGE